MASSSRSSGRRRSGSSSSLPLSDRQIRQGVRFFASLPAGVQKALILGLVLLLLVSGLAWLRSFQWNLGAAFASLSGSRQVSTGFAGSGVQTYSTASQVLEGLTVSEQQPSRRYQRDYFGTPWADIDQNGCDQRNDILARDLQEVSRSKDCLVLSGRLEDPYSSQDIDFVRGPKTSEAVPIDHVVALSNAWSSGAWAWSESQRQLIANDPLNLQASGREANTQKSDKDASLWLPQAGYRCEYVARQVSVKAAYDLTVTAQEKAAMREVLASCPDQPAYRSSFAGS